MTQLRGASVCAPATSQLRPALEVLLSRHFQKPVRDSSLQRKPFAYSSSFSVEELEVRSEESTLTLLLKNLSRHAMLPEARRIKPSFVYDPLREIETYRTILAKGEAGPPTCYGAVVEPEKDRYWLFLEKVPGLELYQVGELDLWKEATGWLARMHYRFARDLPGRREHPSLLHYDVSFYETWLWRACTLQNGDGARSPGISRVLERLVACYDRVVQRLSALPVTFIHGDFYPSNVLVSRSPGGVRVCAVDWEMAAVGPGLVDLAALTAGRWAGREEAPLELALSYYTVLEELGGTLPGREEFLTDLDYCRLHLAVQCLGWSADWSPPLDHAQDWLKEAERLMEKLGL